MTENTIDPIGVEVSTSPPPRLRTRRPAPWPRSCSAKASMSIVERPSRSRVVTTSVSPSCSAAKARSNAGLEARAPETPWSTYRSSRRHPKKEDPAPADRSPADALTLAHTRSIARLRRKCLASDLHDTNSRVHLRYIVTRLAAPEMLARVGRTGEDDETSRNRRDAGRGVAWRGKSYSIWLNEAALNRATCNTRSAVVVLAFSGGYLGG
jgi:hypothetical protein